MSLTDKFMVLGANHGADGHFRFRYDFLHHSAARCSRNFDQKSRGKNLADCIQCQGLFNRLLKFKE